jgi:hypothetical protein
MPARTDHMAALLMSAVLTARMPTVGTEPAPFGLGFAR